jgi:hypothetical protein
MVGLYQIKFVSLELEDIFPYLADQKTAKVPEWPVSRSRGGKGRT